jgi:copper homeostasis protein
MALLEIVAYSYASAKAAAMGGADRIELCENTAEGGTTPSLGTIEAVRRIGRVKLHVMIRPRGGDFLYDKDEFAIMLRDTEVARKAGADGIVIGILKSDATVDVERCRQLVEAAGGMNVTFHRAFDWAIRPLEALEDILKTGCNRILTSGQKPNALAGAERIAELVKASRGRISIMAGGGVNESNVAEIIRLTGVTEVHGSLRGIQQSQMQIRPPDVSLGAPPDWPADAIPVADTSRVRAIRNTLDKA